MLTSTYREIGVFRTPCKMEHFGQIIILLNYFCKKLLNFGKSSEYVSGFYEYMLEF